VLHEQLDVAGVEPAAALSDEQAGKTGTRRTLPPLPVMRSASSLGGTGASLRFRLSASEMRRPQA
jgi:hypothetical protein